MHCFLSKAIIALPTQTQIVDSFEQTVIGGFSCVNTRLAFDSIILLPKNSQNERKKNLKPIYKRKNELKNIFEGKRIVTNEKILKMDKSNKYGNAMTKPLPTGNIKKAKKMLTMKEISLNNSEYFGPR